jgi:FlaG/FlaF family flagellin (archaellin)
MVRPTPGLAALSDVHIQATTVSTWVATSMAMALALMPAAAITSESRSSSNIVPFLFYR